jgi:hypothetical protein
MPPLSDFVVSRGKNVWQKHGQDQFALGNYAEAAAAFTKVRSTAGSALNSKSPY